MRRLAAATAVLAALGLAVGAAAATPDVSKLVLSAKQVGGSYVLLQRTDGHGLGQRTLDLCGTTNYPSEKLRADRLQVEYLRRYGRLGLSNEVVRYKPGGAAQAMREVISHATTCPHTAIDPGEQNLPPLKFTITRLKDSHLLKGYLAVRVQATGVVNGKKVDQVSYAVYQQLGNVISGVYSYVLTGKGYKYGNAADQEAFCLHAAEQSAATLRKLGPTVTGPSA
jgi:hypothetical protein